MSLTLKVWTQLLGGLQAQDRGQEVARSSIERSFIEFCTQNRGLLTSSSSSGPDGDLPHADQVVCVASKQGLRRETGKKKRSQGRGGSKMNPRDGKSRG